MYLYFLILIHREVYYVHLFIIQITIQWMYVLSELKTSEAGRHLAQWSRHLFRVQGFLVQYQDLVPNSSSLLMQTWWSRSDGWHNWTAATHMANLKWAPSSWNLGTEEENGSSPFFSCYREEETEIRTSHIPTSHIHTQGGVWGSQQKRWRALQLAGLLPQ